MRWLMLAVLFAARGCMALQFQSLGAVAPLAGPDLGLDHAAMGTLIGLYWLPGVFLALPAGLLGRRMGLERLAILGLVLMAAGGEVLAVAAGYPAAAAARLLAGSGNALLSVLVSAMVAEWFRDRELSTALAIVFDSWPFGLAAAIAAFPALAATTDSWRWAIHAASAACALAALLVAATYRSPTQRQAPFGLDVALPPAAPARPVGWRRWGSSSLAGLLVPTLAAVVWTAYNAGHIVVLTYAPPMLAGFARQPLADASATVSLAVWAALASTPLGGWLADRTGRPGLPVLVGALGSAAVGLALAAGMQGGFGYLVFGLFMGLPAGSILALPARAALNPADAPRMLGWFMALYYLLLTLAQMLAGFVRQWSASDATTVLLGCILLAIVAGALLPIRLLARAQLSALAAR